MEKVLGTEGRQGQAPLAPGVAAKLTWYYTWIPLFLCPRPVWSGSGMGVDAGRRGFDQFGRAPGVRQDVSLMLIFRTSGLDSLLAIYI
jgi:hypothetical protein